MEKFPSEIADKFVVRLPNDLRDEIKRKAKENGRSMNNEIVSRIMAPPAMTLRDAIAIAVLPAIIEADGIQYAANVTAHAIWAYEQADAMLAAREVAP